MKIFFIGRRQRNKVSSVLIESSLDNIIMLDCGYQPGSIDDINIPNNLISKINAIFLTHAHLDHWGYLPRIVDKGYNGPIYMTRATNDLLENYAFKESFNRLPEKDRLNYKELIYKLRNLIKNIDYGSPVNIKDFSIILLPANHILGSAQVIVEEIKSKRQILYTGDFNPGDNFLFESVNLTDLKNKYGLIIKPDYVIMECSNVDLRDLEYKHQEENFIRLVNETFINMANILIPCKALGDAQEFLIRYLYYCLNKNLSMPSEIFTIGSLLKVNEVYFKFKDSFKDPSFVDFFKMTMLISDFDDYIKSNFANMRDLFFENKRDYGIKLFVATGGSLEVGSSRQIYNKLKNNPNNLIITMKYPYGIKCKAKTINLKIFSLHGNFDAIMRYIKEIQRLNSSHYFLIHGSINNLKLMNEHLNKLNIKNSIPKIGDAIKIGV